MIYMDHAATTYAHSDVVEAMRPSFRTHHYNPSATYAVEEATAVANARESVATLLGTSPESIVIVATLAFISGIEAALSEAMRVLAPDGMVIALVVNTRSEYVQSKRRQKGSCFQRMTHENSDEIVMTLIKYIDGTREYLVGIEDETVIDYADPQTAAMTAIVGSPA
jgi:hypothetical protein